MTELPQKAKPQLLNGPSTAKGPLLKAGTLALLLHIGFLFIFSLSLRSTIAKVGPSVYRVTLRPLYGDGLPKGGPGLPGAEGSATPLPDEKLKPVEKSPREKSKREEVPHTTEKQESQEPAARNEMVEGLKRSPKTGEKLEKKKSSSGSLEEALEEIRKRAALDRIQKRVARREELGRDLTESGSGVETKTGSGSGTGTGTGSGTGGSPEGSPWGSPFGGSALQSKLDEYYTTIWEKIKKEWALPGDLTKGKASLETIIIIVIDRDGKIQKSWFEKKSGNALYDQSTMRAIKKADPLPPIPKEFSDNTFEIGIRFYPE